MRKEASLESTQVVPDLFPGDVIIVDAYEERDGRIRVRFDRGWVSLKEELLLKCDSVMSEQCQLPKQAAFPVISLLLQLMVFFAMLAAALADGIFWALLLESERAHLLPQAKLAERHSPKDGVACGEASGCA